jgi:hypothetical protein
VSYDFAVWEGERPQTSEQAGDVFSGLYEQYVIGGKSPARPKVVAFVTSLLTEYPDLTELDDDHVDESPWSDGPLIGNASGPLFYFGVVPSRAEEMRPFVGTRAREHGLVCFDPQTEELLA